MPIVIGWVNIGTMSLSSSTGVYVTPKTVPSLLPVHVFVAVSVRIVGSVGSGVTVANENELSPQSMSIVMPSSTPGSVMVQVQVDSVSSGTIGFPEPSVGASMPPGNSTDSSTGSVGGTFVTVMSTLATPTSNPVSSSNTLTA